MNEDVSKVLVILFLKINQFTLDKRFCSYGNISLKNLYKFTNTRMHT